MRKLVPLLAVALAFASCATMAASMTPQDLGVYNPKSVADTELCTLRIKGYLKVISIDDSVVRWESSMSGRQATIRLPAGVHVLKVHYNNGQQYTKTPLMIIAVMAAGKSYFLDYYIQYAFVKIDIVDEETKKSAAVTLNNPFANPGSSVTMDFIKKIMEPGMDKVNKTVKMESADYTLIFKPDMIFTLTDKKTGAVQTGRRGFVTDLTFKEGRVYLLVVDPATMSRDEFLNKSDYTTNANYILLPVECSDAKVKFKIEKPAELAGTFWEFDTSVYAEGGEK